MGWPQWTWLAIAAFIIFSYATVPTVSKKQLVLRILVEAGYLGLLWAGGFFPWP